VSKNNIIKKNFICLDPFDKTLRQITMFNGVIMGTA